MQNIPTIKRFGGASLHHHPPGVAFDFLSFAHSSTTIDANHTIRWCCCSDLFSVLKIQVNSLAGQTTIYFLLGEISPVWMDDGGSPMSCWVVVVQVPVDELLVNGINKSRNKINIPRQRNKQHSLPNAS